MKLAFVMIEPKVSENVGAAARALKTMGFTQLWLVNSQAHLDARAAWVAHGSADILENVRCFDSLEAVRAAAELLIGTTAKGRHGKRELHRPAQVRHLLCNKGETLVQAALVFGREDRGLSNAELALCDLITGIPLASPQPSLNLGQAVMLYAWELSGLKTATVEHGTPDSAWEHLGRRLEALLPHLGVAPQDKLAQWLRERLPLLADKDVRFLHTLAANLENVLKRDDPPRDGSFDLPAG